jgi:hypothetical protein
MNHFRSRSRSNAAGVHHHRSTLIASIHPRHVFPSLFHLYSTIQIQINPIPSFFFTYSFNCHFPFFFSATNMAKQGSNSVIRSRAIFFKLIFSFPLVIFLLLKAAESFSLGKARWCNARKAKGRGRRETNKTSRHLRTHGHVVSCLFSYFHLGHGQRNS